MAVFQDIYSLDIDPQSVNKLSALVDNVSMLEKKLDKLDNTSEDYIKTEKQLQSATTQLNRNLRQQINTTDGLENKISVLERQVSKTKKKTDEYRKSVSRLKTSKLQLKKATGNLTPSISGFQKTLTRGVGLMAAYFSVQQIVEFGKAFLDLGKKIEGTAQKSQTVFKEFRGKVQEFARKNAQDFGLTKRELEDLAAASQDLLVPIGFERGQATDITLKLQTLTGALAEWSNGKFTAAQTSEILTKSLLGEREQLKGLGIDLKDADIKQRLLEKGQKRLTGNALKQATALATLEILYEKSTDAQEAYANNAGSLERLEARNTAAIKERKEAFAKFLLPVYRESLLLTDKLLSLLKPQNDRIADSVNSYKLQANAFENNKKKLEELLPQYEELKSKSNTSEEAQKKLRDVIGEIGDIVPSAVTGLEEYGRAIDINIEQVKLSLSSLQEIIKSTKEDVINDIEDSIKQQTRKIADLQLRSKGGSRVEVTGIGDKQRVRNIDVKALEEEIRKLIALRASSVLELKSLGLELTDEQKRYLEVLNEITKGNNKNTKSTEEVALGLQFYKDKVDTLNKELLNLDQFSQAAKDKSIELAAAKKELVKQEAQYKKNVGDSNKATKQFVEGSLNFYKNEVSNLEKNLQNTNLTSEEAVKVSEKLNKAKEQLAEAQKKYNNLIEDEAKIRSFEETAKQLKEVKEALKNIDLPESERNEKIKEAAELQNRHNKELKDYEEITNRIALAANKEIEKPLDPLTPKTEITRSIPDIEKDINFAKEKLKELDTFSPTYVADKNALDAQIESLEKELQRAKLEIPIKPKVETNVGGADNLDTTRNAFAEFADTELFQVLESLDQVAAGINSINDAVIAGIDRRIAAQENAVSKVSEIADKGNAELLESEQRKLDELQRKRQRFVAAQRALDAIAAISNIIVTITKTSAESGVASPATIPIVLGAIAGGIGAGLALINNIPGAATGEEYINGEGTSTSDSILRRVSKGERVVKAKDNKDYWDTLSAIHHGDVPAKTLNDFVNAQKAGGFDLAAIAAQTPPTLMELAKIKGFELNVNNSSTYENKKLIEQNKVMIQELSKIRQELEYQKQTPPPKKVRRFIPDNNRMIEIEKRAK